LIDKYVISLLCSSSSSLYFFKYKLVFLIDDLKIGVIELNLLFEGNNDGGCKINELQQTINKLTKNKDFINNFII
jgi:hypothetical protein